MKNYKFLEHAAMSGTILNVLDAIRE